MNDPKFLRPSIICILILLESFIVYQLINQWSFWTFIVALFIGLLITITALPSKIITSLK